MVDFHALTPSRLEAYFVAHLDAVYQARSMTCCPVAGYFRDTAGASWKIGHTAAVTPEGTMVRLPEWVQIFIVHIDACAGVMTGARALAMLSELRNELWWV